MKKNKDISKQELLIKDGQTVITTSQLAKVYGTTSKNITNNFQRNKDRFIEGKHYFILHGEELREFKSMTSERGVPLSSSNTMYLWTRRGASRHCKILGTDKAWEQFDYLEENYFDRQEQKQPQTLQQQIQTIAKGTDELYSRMDGLEDKFTKFQQELPMLPDDADEVKDSVNRRVVSLLGGKQSNAYKDKSLSKKVFMDAYRELKRNFNVSRYKAIRRNQKEQALQIISNYQPPYFLAEQIRNENAQENLDL